MWLDGIRAIYFDAVGTLIHPEPGAAAVYAAVARQFGSRLTVNAIAERFTTALAREESRDRAGDWRTSEDREHERWRHIVAAVLDDVTDAGACFQALYAHFSRPEAWRCDRETPALLERLAADGYVLGLASNYDHRLRLVAAGRPELRPLGKLVISAEVGWRKPAPEFFAAVCRSAGWPAEAILYVGDDPANDYHGAERAGLRPVLVDCKRRYGGAVTRRIACLAELDRRATI